ncbi:MAG TPA: serine/threonine-protein kinase [Chloroflexota bacterium]|nr:serine/threonine-protein kinase [Chloroflexota bacterium]
MRLAPARPVAVAVPGTTAPSRSAAKGYAPLAPDTVLDNRYRVLQALAEGAMGAVYRAEDIRLGGKHRALKELLQHWGTLEERAEAEAWFMREGETLMRLQHPAIPVVHDTFSEGQRHYLVMDLVEGRSLEQVLLDEGRPGLPESRVLPWAEQVLDVLSYLHGRPDSLIFRDLKPANLMLTPQGQIRLIDFGIARAITRQAQGTAIGTPGYAPPEQYQGLAEPASDLYALGATMHHLLTGRDPRKHRPFDFPPVRSVAPEISVPVAAAIDRSLALDPRARHGTAPDMRKALRATAPLDGSPRRTVTGSLSRSATGSGTMPILTPRGGVPGVSGTNGAAMPADPRAIKLRPHELRIATAGNATLTPIDKRTVRLRNRTSQRLLCTFDSDVPWLRPDRPAAWLEPDGRMEVSLSVVQPQGRVHSTLGNFRVQEQGGQSWTVPVRLQVRGGHAVMAHSFRGGLRGVAMVCFFAGVLALALGVLGVHLLSQALAWNLIVIGLVGRVIMRVMRGGEGI